MHWISNIAEIDQMEIEEKGKKPQPLTVEWIMHDSESNKAEIIIY